MALPARVESFPISRRVSTVMLTEVAVRTTPTKTFSRMVPEPRLKQQASAVPPARGTSTPISAMIKAAFPDLRSSSKSVVKPAVNISTMTPSSDRSSSSGVSCNTFSTAGPSRSPASSAPTTWGMAKRLVKIPSALVLNKINASSNRK